MSDETKTYDYIIVGAGPGGSPLASRLSEREDISVAILEAGGENVNSVSRIQGAMMRVWGTDYDWNYHTTEQDALNGRSIYHPRGKVLGGSSAINVGVWLRGVPADFDAWNEQGASGWDGDTAVRLFKVIEDSDRGPSEYRGKGGPMYMETMPSASSLPEQLLEGFAEAGLGSLEDTNSGSGFSAARIQSIYENRRRRTVADNYLSHEIRKRENLSVYTGALAKKVLFENGKAVGIEFEQDGQTKQLKASKEVILSAGAFNTPQLLLLSGIGPKDELEKLGIDVLADVPGVGKNLQDHLSITVKAVAPQAVDVSVPMNPSDEAIKEWVWSQRGPASYFSSTTVGFISKDGVDEGSPDSEVLFDYNANATGEEPAFKNVDEAKKRSGYGLSVIMLHPESRGEVRLKSADIHDAPVVDPKYLSDTADEQTFIEIIRRAMKMTQADALKPYTEAVSPAVDSSDEDILDYIRDSAGTVFHPVGTAKMGAASDPMAVVDEELRVRGVSGLRVSDASVMPTLTSGHTMSPTVMISEHAAELILGK